MPETQSLALVVSALDALVKTVTNVLGVAEQNIDAAYRISDKMSARKEQEHIDAMLHDLSMLSRSQGIVPMYLILEANRLEDPSKTEPTLARTRIQIASTMDGLLTLLSRIFDRMSHTNSTALEREPALYDDLVQAMRVRTRILDEVQALARGEIALTPADAPLLRKMADDYGQLRQALQRYRGQLGELAARLDAKDP